MKLTSAAVLAVAFVATGCAVQTTEATDTGVAKAQSAQTAPAKGAPSDICLDCTPTDEGGGSGDGTVTGIPGVSNDNSGDQSETGDYNSSGWMKDNNGPPIIGGGPSLPQCLAACSEGGEPLNQLCRSIPHPAVRAGCWAVTLTGVVACTGFCYANF